VCSGSETVGKYVCLYMPICTHTSFDFVAQSFKLIDGMGSSSPFFAISLRRCTPVVISSLTPLHFKAIREAACRGPHLRAKRRRLLLLLLLAAVAAAPAAADIHGVAGGGVAATDENSKRMFESKGASSRFFGKLGAIGILDVCQPASGCRITDACGDQRHPVSQSLVVRD
jgi:hypothetical protein